MTRAGLQRFLCNYSAFAKNFSNEKVVIVIVYLNNFLLFGPNLNKINKMEKMFADCYKIKNLGSSNNSPVSK